MDITVIQSVLNTIFINFLKKEKIMNRKKNFGYIAVLAIASMSTVNVNYAKNEVDNSDTLLMNGGSGCSCTKKCPDGITTLSCSGTVCDCCMGYYYVICDNVKSTC